MNIPIETPGDGEVKLVVAVVTADGHAQVVETSLSTFAWKRAKNWQMWTRFLWPALDQLRDGASAT